MDIYGKGYFLVSKKDKLTREPVLKMLNHKYQTELNVEASQDGFGAVLLQKDTEDCQLR